MLEVLLHRFGRVVSKEQLVEQLYSYDKDVSHNTIEVYVHRCARRSPAAGVTVRTLYGRGYMIDYVAPCRRVSGATTSSRTFARRSSRVRERLRDVGVGAERRARARSSCSRPFAVSMTIFACRAARGIAAHRRGTPR